MGNGCESQVQAKRQGISTKIHIFLVVIVFISNLIKCISIRNKPPTQHPLSVHLSFRPVESIRDSLLGNMTLLFFLPLLLTRPPLPAFDVLPGCKAPCEIKCVCVFVRGTHPDKVLNTCLVLQFHRCSIINDFV